jgi:predicted negative regulator of RcsB-dependent stress response
MVPVQGQFNWLVGLGWAGLLATAWFLARASRTVQFWALWIVVFLLPVLQIIPFPIWVADRYLYISAIGGFVLASQLFFRTWERLRVPWPRWGLECAMIAAVLLFAWRTVRHVPVWKSDLALWEATTPTCMGSAYCHMNLGLALLQNGHTERGIKEMIRSAEIRPGARFLERLGDALSLAAGDYRQATVAYTMALEKEGRNPTSEVYAKLARVHLLEGNLDEAARVIDLGKEINPNDPSLWIADGLLQWRLGNNDQARLSLRRALAMTGRTSNPAEFIYQFWGNAADVGRLLADLRRSQPVPSNK